MQKFVKWSLLGCLSAAFAGSALAATTDATTFQVKITITESCDIHTTAATAVDFGSVVRSVAASQATGGLKVNCSSGTPYTIALDNGSNYDTTNSVRRMINGSNYIAYGLYRTTGTTAPWNALTANLYSGTGTGAVVNVPVYGTVSGSTNVPAGTYIDTVTATLTY